MNAYRQADAGDAAGILKLQARNLVTNLSDEQKKNGFVTTPFTREQLHALIRGDGLFVIDTDGAINGYAAAAGWDYFKGRPMFGLMIELFQRIDYKGMRITRGNSFQYGPICVDGSLRGTEAFPELFAEMKRTMSKKYEIGTTFINKVNGRSYAAHTKKARLDVINEFDFNGNRYYGLAFLTE